MADGEADDSCTVFGTILYLLPIRSRVLKKNIIASYSSTIRMSTICGLIYLKLNLIKLKAFAPSLKIYKIVTRWSTYYNSDTDESVGIISATADGKTKSQKIPVVAGQQYYLILTCSPTLTNPSYLRLDGKITKNITVIR